MMARDTSPEEETAVVKVKVDRGLVREEVSFAKLVADLARKQKCTVYAPGLAGLAHTVPGGGSASRDF